MQDEQLLRYSRHILLNELGVEGQERLLASRALVIGAGGWVHRWRCTWAAPAWAT
jgi:molybdopterin/thiamine biosynthesis adenylyltransferase